jgi:hypothetical protein
MLFRRSNSLENEAALLQRAADWENYPSLHSLDDKTLIQVTRDEGVDFATALLFDRFQKCPRHAEFIQQIDRLRISQSPPPMKLHAKVVIVPGALYVERPEMGGDGRVVREVSESLGYETELIPIASFGSITKNAALIRAWLEAHRQEQIILVSLSKGGADLRMAFASAGSEGLFGKVLAWINVCGPLNGSRMADWVMASRWRTFFCRTKFLFQKRDFQFITELCHGRFSSSPLSPESPIRAIHLIGFPLARHMTTRFSRFCHRTLTEWGPNDGTTSLSDVSKWPGEIYPVWGADHYFRPEEVARSLITALLYHLSIQHIGE